MNHRPWPSPKNILAERDALHAPIQLCLDLGHPFASGATGPDADPYAWLEHFGPRVPEVQLQQTDGRGDHHWPFTPEHNAVGRVDPGRVLDTLAAADPFTRAAFLTWSDVAQAAGMPMMTRAQAPWIFSPGFYQRFPALVAELIAEAE